MGRPVYVASVNCAIAEVPDKAGDGACCGEAGFAVEFQRRTCCEDFALGVEHAYGEYGERRRRDLTWSKGQGLSVDCNDYRYSVGQRSGEPEGRRLEGYAVARWAVAGDYGCGTGDSSVGA